MGIGQRQRYPGVTQISAFVSSTQQRLTAKQLDQVHICLHHCLERSSTITHICWSHEQQQK
jgi:hypothetical protein